MEKINVSLKNVYKLLMTQDFPIYSESVIAERNRKGQTRLRFWQSMVVDEFRSLPYGQLIWRNAGKRNRYISNLCNRNTEMKFYREYAEEIASQVNPAALLSQTQKFMNFLADKEYRHDILMRRISEFVRLCRAEDACFSREVDVQFKECLTLSVQYGKYGAQGKLFHAAYLLTLLTIYAAAGEAMNDPVLAVLREKENGIEVLWEMREKQDGEEREPVVWLTVHAGIMQDNPLPGRSFFGRDEELYDLKEMAVQGMKCLISGIGGIGKTELLRQLICSCAEDHTVDYIAVVPYENSIVESVARAFPGFRRENPEESFHQVCYQLEQKAKSGNRVLLLVDNLTCGVAEDPDLKRLAELSGSVLITSRRTQMDGFEVYRIENPSVSTGALIFRDNYGQPLSRKDRECLTGMLRNEALCHPLTLRLMARAAKSKNWSVQQLKEYLEENRVDLNWREEEYTVKLSVVYRQLYSNLRVPEDCRSVAELFTLMPRESYSGEFLAEIFGALIGSGESLNAKLDALAEGGWLDADGGGYSMHPLIAQCLRRRVLNEERLGTVLHALRTRLPQDVLRDDSLYYNEKLRRICNIVVYVFEFLTGGISGELMRDVLTAMNLLLPARQTVKRYERLLEQALRHCTQRNDQVEVSYCTTLGHWNAGDADMFEAVYRRQKERLTVPEMQFLDFCLYAGNRLTMVQRPDAAEEMLREALCDEASCVQKATAYYHLCVNSQFCGNVEAAVEWSQKGAEYVSTHPECGKDLIFANLSVLCSFYLKYAQKALAEPLLKQLKGYMGEDSLFMHKVQYADLAGAYELNFGNVEQAVRYYQEELTIRLEYYGKDQNYYVTLGQMAIAYQRLKWYDEALGAYHTIIDYARQAGDIPLLHMFSNNLAVLYLDLEKPEEAVFHLNTALEFAKKQGGIALGEGLKNMARAHRLSGEAEKELICLKEACPLLDAAYGSDHPRAKAARERLSELEA